MWEGWNVALKPAYEPIIVAMKPRDGTFANNALRWGVAGLWVDGGRIGTSKNIPASPSKHMDTRCHGKYRAEDGTASGFNPNQGRWPANLILDEAAAAMLDQMSGERSAGHYPNSRGNGGIGCDGHSGQQGLEERYTDRSGASRFFYCAKASRTERGDGNDHPTVKPVALMRWLVRLVTPPGGLVLDPFGGSGTTAVACIQEGFGCTLIEQDEHNCDIARRRVAGERVRLPMEAVV